MAFRDSSHLYTLAPGLYARTQADCEKWRSLSANERARYVDAASTRPGVHDASRQILRRWAHWAWRPLTRPFFGRIRSFIQ